jgi:hypothetical protein
MAEAEMKARGLRRKDMIKVFLGLDCRCRYDALVG